MMPAIYSTLINAPLNHVINDLSLETPDEYGARVGQMLKLVAGPIDRIFQALLLLPLFTLMIQYRRIASNTNFTHRMWHIVFTPIAIALAVLGSTLFLIWGICQIFLPYKPFYGICKGKDAAYEYAVLRSDLILNSPEELINLLPTSPLNLPPASVLAHHSSRPPFEPYRILSHEQKYTEFFLKIITTL